MRRNERIAHDLICIIKYGSIGGDVSASEVSRLVNHMERTGLVQRELPTVRIPGSNPPAPRGPKPAPPPNPPSITIPKINGLPVLVMHNPDAPSAKLPSIRLP